MNETLLRNGKQPNKKFIKWIKKTHIDPKNVLAQDSQAGSTGRD